MITHDQETLSIIIPCYNEEGNVRKLHRELSRHLHEMGVTYMIWFIDDGSTDQTLDVIKELASSDFRVKYISFSRNFGHQKALKAGLDRANGKALIMMDADLQHPIPIITALFEKWKEGYEVVNTIRGYHHSWNPIKIITSHDDYVVLKNHALFYFHQDGFTWSPFVVYSHKTKQTYKCSSATSNPLFFAHSPSNVPPIRYNDETFLVAKSAVKVMDMKESIFNSPLITDPKLTQLYDGLTEGSNPVLFLLHVKPI